MSPQNRKSQKKISSQVNMTPLHKIEYIPIVNSEHTAQVVQVPPYLVISHEYLTSLK